VNFDPEVERERDRGGGEVRKKREKGMV